MSLLLYKTISILQLSNYHETSAVNGMDLKTDVLTIQIMFLPVLKFITALKFIKDYFKSHDQLIQKAYPCATQTVHLLRM